jgi:hypothetical protein
MPSGASLCAFAAFGHRSCELGFQRTSRQTQANKQGKWGRAALLFKHSREKAEIMGIIGRMEQEFAEVEADAKHEYSSIRDDTKNRSLEEKHSLRIQLEGTVEDLWRQFQLALNQYTATTEERKRQFEELKQKDQRNAREIEAQMKRLVKLQETMSHYKTKLSTNAKDFEERNRSLREEKDAIQKQYHGLKRRMVSLREQEHRKLVELALLSQKTLRDLRERVAKAEDIVRLAEMNRKLETEAEKVLPFYAETEPDAAEAAAAAGALVKAGAPEAAEVPPEIAAIAQFHKRFNKAALDRAVLQQRLGGLREENAYLKNILRQYLEGITVSPAVLEAANPLVVVNGVTNAPLAPQYGRNITVVEGANHIAAYAGRRDAV